MFCNAAAGLISQVVNTNTPLRAKNPTSTYNSRTNRNDSIQYKSVNTQTLISTKQTLSKYTKPFHEIEQNDGAATSHSIQLDNSPLLLPLTVGATALSVKNQGVKPITAAAMVAAVTVCGFVASYAFSKTPELPKKGSLDLDNEALDDNEYPDPLALGSVSGGHNVEPIDCDKIFQKNFLAKEGFNRVAELRENLLDGIAQLNITDEDEKYYRYALYTASYSKEVAAEGPQFIQTYYLSKVIQILSYISEVAPDEKKNVWEDLINKYAELFECQGDARTREEIINFHGRYLEKDMAAIQEENPTVTNRFIAYGKSVNVDTLALSIEQKERVILSEQTKKISSFLVNIGLMRSNEPTINCDKWLLFFLQNPNDKDYIYTNSESIDAVYEILKGVLQENNSFDYTEDKINEDFKVELINSFIFNRAMGVNFHYWLAHMAEKLTKSGNSAPVLELKNSLIQSIKNKKIDEKVKKYLYQNILLLKFPYFSSSHTNADDPLTLKHAEGYKNSDIDVNNVIGNLTIASPEYYLMHAGYKLNMQLKLPLTTSELQLLGEAFVRENSNANDLSEKFKEIAYISNGIRDPYKKIESTERKDLLINLLSDLDYNLMLYILEKTQSIISALD